MAEQQQQQPLHVPPLAPAPQLRQGQTIESWLIEYFNQYYYGGSSDSLQAQAQAQVEEAMELSGMLTAELAPATIQMLLEPINMKLYDHEIERAWQIKNAIEANPDIQNLTDFEYVSYALSTVTLQAGTESIEQVVHRIYMMQCFREEYDVADTLEEGIQIINEFTLQHPGCTLLIDFLPDGRNFVNIEDLAKLFLGNLDNDHKIRVYMVGMYYKTHCKMPFFWAVRDGATAICECDGMTLDNYDSVAFERVNEQLLKWYPTKNKELFFLNTPTVMTFVWGLWKRLLNKNFRETFYLGHRFEGMEGIRLDAVYLTPTPEIARQRVICKSFAFLQLRYKNQRDYKLPPSPAVAAAEP